MISFLIFILQGCVITGTTLSDKKYEPTDASKIELYYSKMPNREYDEIAFIYLSNILGRDKDLKIAAAKLGANAIIQIRTERTISGYAIRWK